MKTLEYFLAGLIILFTTGHDFQNFFCLFHAPTQTESYAKLYFRNILPEIAFLLLGMKKSFLLFFILFKTDTIIKENNS